MNRATAALDALIQIIERLRGPDGCPWDREQSAASMARFLIEEAHELADAITEGHDAHVCEELGDVLFHVLFIAQMHAEKGKFDLEQVCRGIGAKMQRRHPHVFGSAKVADSAEVVRNWRQIKHSEKAHGTQPSALDSVPAGLPGLMRAYAVSERAAGARFDWEHLPGVLAKLQEELAEFAAAAARKDAGETAQEFGDILFTMVNLARFSGVHPETALIAAVQKFERRFRRMEAIVAGSGRDLEAVPQSEKDRIWETVKSEERRKHSPGHGG
jgi:tetrapyrrole methylase family protein/MazG family protein